MYINPGSITFFHIFRKNEYFTKSLVRGAGNLILLSTGVLETCGKFTAAGGVTESSGKSLPLLTPAVHFELLIYSLKKKKIKMRLMELSAQSKMIFIKT